MADVEKFIRETIDNLLAMAEREATLPAAGDLDMAVLYLRHYLRRSEGRAESSEGIGGRR